VLDSNSVTPRRRAARTFLFHEAMLERNGESHIVLPYEKQFFSKDSVELIGKRLDRPVRTDHGWSRGDPGSFEEKPDLRQCFLRVCKSVATRSRQHPRSTARCQAYSTRCLGRQAGDEIGGTAATIERWRGAGLKWKSSIWPRSWPKVHRSFHPAGRCRCSRSAALCQFSTAIQSRIRALLFADAEGFSKLSDEEVPRFVEHFLGLAGSLAEDSTHKPLVKNTWGDGLYFVFEHVREAGLFALELRDRVRCTDWMSRGLPI